jgi:hypothetical protein
MITIKNLFLKNFFILSILIIFTCIVIIIGAFNFYSYRANIKINELSEKLESDKVISDKTIIEQDYLIQKYSKKSNNSKTWKVSLKKNVLLSKYLYNNKDHFYFADMGEKLIKTKNNNLNLKIFDTFFIKQNRNYGKPGGYFEQYKNNIILSSGNGVFLYFEKSFFKDDVIRVTSIPSNIDKFSELLAANNDSVRDLLIVDDKLFVSVDTVNQYGCTNASILFAKISFDYLDFKEFYNPNLDYCRHLKESDNIDTVRSGARMVKYKDNKLIYTIGSYGIISQMQSTDSLIGKIITIDLDTKEIEMISMGHRNPQGLFYDKLLAFEPFFKPGTIIVSDGRVANFRFLLNNLQRDWSYYENDKIDQHYLYLKEKPLGKVNENQIKFYKSRN